MRAPAAVALAFAILAARPAAAQQDDPIAGARCAQARLRAIPQAPAARPAREPASYSADAANGLSFRGEREAAVGFVDLVRKFPDQRVEYCAYVLKGADGRFTLGRIRQGDMNMCPSERPKPKEAVASVHTHPLWGRPEDVSAAGQVFSEGDFAFAESAEMSFAEYLGAPAGHVLRYAPGGSACKGQSFIRRDFEIVRDLRPSVRGRLPIEPGKDMPLYDEGGRKLPKPAYCRPL
jgi:hypothetical protein